MIITELKHCNTINISFISYKSYHHQPSDNQVIFSSLSGSYKHISLFIIYIVFKYIHIIILPIEMGFCMNTY